MSALKWTTAETRHVLMCSSIDAVVIDKGDHAVAIVLMHGHREDCATVDEAKAACEKHMRQLLADLQAQFAPVLRWEGDTARFLEYWTLSIGQQSDGLYWWQTMLDESFGEDGGDCADEASARRAAEAALRSLGVVFRVEESDGAK